MWYPPISLYNGEGITHDLWNEQVVENMKMTMVGKVTAKGQIVAARVAHDTVVVAPTEYGDTLTCSDECVGGVTFVPGFNQRVYRMAAYGNTYSNAYTTLGIQIGANFVTTHGESTTCSDTDTGQEVDHASTVYFEAMVKGETALNINTAYLRLVIIAWDDLLTVPSSRSVVEVCTYSEALTTKWALWRTADIAASLRSAATTLDTAAFAFGLQAKSDNNSSHDIYVYGGKVIMNFGRTP